jgi:selenocysteine-specific elongation factor
MKGIVVGTAGHIDHGKSALVRALTGTDPDRLKEERERGITIDLGFAHCEIGGINFAFVDVPGHERFVRNMLAGAGGIDAIVLVVAADESVMPQTREHFQICRLLQVSSGIVALTKADLVDSDMLELVADEVRTLTAGTFLDGAPIVPVSSKTGIGLDEVRRALEGLGRRLPGRAFDGPARLPIDRVFSKKGFGTVVTGTLVSGRLTLDRELELLPGGRRVKVRGLQVHGAAQQEACAGSRTAVNVSGVDVEDIRRGQSLVEPGAFRETQRVDAVMHLLPEARPLKHGARVHVHQGTAEMLARVTVAGPPTDGMRNEERGTRGGFGETKNVERGTRNVERGTRNLERGTRNEAGDVQPGATAYVRLRLESPAVLVRGDRYILRAYSPTTTIAGGEILDPQPPRGRVRTAEAIDRFRAIDLPRELDGARADEKRTTGARDETRAALEMIAESDAFGMPAADLTIRLGVAPAVADGMAERLIAQHGLVAAGDRLVAAAVVARLEKEAEVLLGRFHAAQPLSDGMPREELRQRLVTHSDPAIFDRIIERLASAGRVAGSERIRLASHQVALTAEEASACAFIEQAYREAGLTPLDAGSVAAGAPASTSTLERMTALLTRQKQLVAIGTLLFHRDVLERLKEDVRALKGGGASPTLDVATFKERFGVSRKFAIPLLEYLDRERVTRRVRDARVIL